MRALGLTHPCVHAHQILSAYSFTHYDWSPQSLKIDHVTDHDPFEGNSLFVIAYLCTKFDNPAIPFSAIPET